MPAKVDQIQSASMEFFWPIASAYVAVCMVWLILRRLAQSRWRDEPKIGTEHRWLDFGMIFVAAVGTFGIGAAYRKDLLIPKFAEPWSDLSTTINLCLPFLPIFLILLIRRQSLNTIWISKESIHWKIATGMISAAVGLFVFLGLRSEINRLPEVLNGLVNVRSWIHAPAVFLEAVAVAFVFTRLRWVAHPAFALLIPCLLFAAAHVPSGISSGRSTWEIIGFFVFNTVLSAFIFWIVTKSRDVIWIAIPHFVLDIATGVFD